MGKKLYIYIDPPIKVFYVHGNGDTIRIGRNNKCLLYAEFFSSKLKKVTEDSTEHQKWHIISKKKCVKTSIFARSAKITLNESRNPPQELEVSPRSELNLLVDPKETKQ